MARYKILQTFDARHETFKAGDIVTFEQWKANDALFQYSNLPQNGLEAATAAHDQARLDDIKHLILVGKVEDLDKDEIGKVDMTAVPPETIADAQRLLYTDWRLRTTGEQKPKKPLTLDDVLASKDIAVRLVTDPGQQPTYGSIERVTDEAFGVQVPYEAGLRWYAKAGFDIPTRTFNGAGAADDSAFRKAAAVVSPRAAAMQQSTQSASDQPA